MHKTMEFRSSERFRSAIKMCTDLITDYYLFSQRELGFTKSNLHYFFLKKVINRLFRPTQKYR